MVFHSIRQPHLKVEMLRHVALACLFMLNGLGHARKLRPLRLWIASSKAFGGQRSIQLSYGRLWASIDQTPASGNALDIAGFCSIGLCVKAPAAKFGRSNRLGRASRSRAAGVPADFLSADRVGKRACHYQAIIEGLCS
jgi:hypothetical protein